jgi:hypothetical protein
MSKAEERGKTYALHKASEKLHDYYGNAMLSVVQFDGYDIKNAYIDGYQKAEKDLELTWEDMEEIYFLFKAVRNEWYGHEFSDYGICREVLKRFKEKKGKNYDNCKDKER